jgi:hypothetical protein
MSAKDCVLVRNGAIIGEPALVCDGGGVRVFRLADAPRQRELCPNYEAFAKKLHEETWKEASRQFSGPEVKPWAELPHHVREMHVRAAKAALEYWFGDMEKATDTFEVVLGSGP